MTRPSPQAPASTTFFLVRHGQTQSNLLRRFVGQLDSPLTELGRRQAQLAAERLRGKGIDVAYTSTLGRAVSTAEVICSALGLESFESDALREMCFGPWQGLEIDDAQRRWPEQFANFRRSPRQFSLEGAETFGELETRIAAGIRSIATTHPGKKVLVVSHGVAIKVLLLHLGGRGLAGFPDMPTMNNGDHVEVTVPSAPSVEGPRADAP